MGKITQRPRFKKQPIAGLGQVLGALSVLLLLTAATAPAQEQSSQDHAIVNAARGKATHKAKIVVTDDDMPSHPQPVETQASTGNTDNHDQGDGTQKQSEPDANAPRQVVAPKNLTPEQGQALLDKLKAQEQSLNRQYDEIQDKLDNTTDELLRKVYSNLLSNRDDVLAQKRKEIESAERGLQAANEARKSQGETRDAAK
ncbi:MAG TPA: hypothetical protein VEV41_10790 [Terriglobales bacterium]|nr:hypothetical protein [Terriglobales bacterium]